MVTTIPNQVTIVVVCFIDKLLVKLKKEEEDGKGFPNQFSNVANEFCDYFPKDLSSVE